MSCSSRLNRLFAPDGRCFDLALDHGFFNEHGLLSGLENIATAVRTGIRLGVDAIQVTPGQAGFLQNERGRQKPSLVLRVDTANVYGWARPRPLFDELIGEPVEQALRLDAVCVILNVFYLREEPALHRHCLRNLADVVAAGQRYGMPVMVEPLVMRGNSSDEYSSAGDPDEMVALIRQVVEMGADVVKCDPTEPVNEFHRIVEAACGKPVLPRGGGRVSQEQILQRTADLLGQGASGIVYGRNITQHPRPEAMGRALLKLVHGGATVEEAARELE